MSVETLEKTNHAFEGLLAGKVGLIFGVASKHSIAWGIAQRLKAAGMTLVFTYQGDRLKENVEELIAPWNEDILLVDCDVTNDDHVKNVFAAVQAKYGKLDTLVHCVAFAKKDDLAGRYVDTSREGYLLSQDISAYSLTTLCREAEPLMEAAGGGSVIALTYLGGERVVKNYNVMGVAKAALDMSIRYLAADLGPKNIRVNAISAGPIKTLAAMGISGFKSILKYMEEHTPMKRNVTQDEVGGTALYLAADTLSSGVTGEVIHVDAGFHIVGF
ncbi:MAG: enoyl-ACP reductase [Vampirovibrionales bacterium]